MGVEAIIDLRTEELKFIQDQIKIRKWMAKFDDTG